MSHCARSVSRFATVLLLKLAVPSDRSLEANLRKELEDTEWGLKTPEELMTWFESELKTSREMFEWSRTSNGAAGQTFAALNLYRQVIEELALALSEEGVSEALRTHALARAADADYLLQLSEGRTFDRRG